MVLIINLEKELNIRDLQHELELALMEERLAEYAELQKEREIKAEEDLFRALRGFRLKGVERWGYDEPPRMRRIMPGATTDWDFSRTSWYLDTITYHSAPSSLFADTAGYSSMAILCKYAGTYPLDQGRIVSWLMVPTSISALTVGSWGFRNNNAPGSAVEGVDCYMVTEQTGATGTRDNTKCRFSGGVMAAVERTYNAGANPPFDTWDLRRVTWWVSAGVLMVRLEVYNGGWAKAFDDFTDTLNQFTGNPNRRCGFIGKNRNCRWDDTEIWGP